jgi:hypothetical protein
MPLDVLAVSIAYHTSTNLLFDFMTLLLLSSIIPPNELCILKNSSSCILMGYFIGVKLKEVRQWCL